MQKPRETVIEVRDFLSIKHARLKTVANHAVIAGLNGCGKSQFLAAIAGSLLGQHMASGDRLLTQDTPEVDLSWTPQALMYFPPQRMATNLDEPIGPTYATRQPSGAFGAVHAGMLGSPHDLITPTVGGDYALQDLVVSPMAAARVQSSGLERGVGQQLQQSLDLLTGKRICRADGGTLARWLVTSVDEAGPVLPFGSLSSGEKHLAVLLADVATCDPCTLVLVDEIERHLHPSLQASLLESLLSLLPQGSFLLMTTHSPAVILSGGRDELWWMVDAEAAKGGSQLLAIGGDATLTTRVFDLYGGRSATDCVPDLLVRAYKEEFGRFLDQCYESPEADDRTARGERNPQISDVRKTLQTLLATQPDRVIRYVDFGCGEGRCMAAFDAIPTSLRERIDVTLVDPDHPRREKAVASAQQRQGIAGLHDCASIASVEAADYIVAVNVFHEIVGDAFVEEFALLWERLDPDGLLHVLEIGCLPRGERGYLMVSPSGYEAFFRGLQAVPVVPEPERRGPVEFVTVVVRRGPDRTSHLVRDAYTAALKATRADCVAKLAAEENQNVRRAFWLENLASVETVLDGLVR